MSTVQFWLDLAPQIIGIVCLAVYSWRRMNAMSAHLDRQDDHLTDQDDHLISHGRHLRAISGQLNQLVGNEPLFKEDPK